MKNISENTIKLFKSNYKLAISELENKILEKEMEYDCVFQEETEWTNVRVANVSILDESYSIYFKPTTFEL